MRWGHANALNQCFHLEHKQYAQRAVNQARDLHKALPLINACKFSTQEQRSSKYKYKFPTPNLELVDLILSIAQLLQDPTALASPALLPKQRLLHRRRPTDHDLRVIIRGRRGNLLQEGLGNIPLPVAVALALEPAHRVHGLELARVARLVLLELLVEEHVLLAVDTEDERDLGLVLWVVEDSLDELVDRGDARAAGDERHRAVLVGRPLVAGDAYGKHDAVTRAERVQVCGLLSLRIPLYQKIHVACCVCRRYGCVWPEDREIAALGNGEGEQRRCDNQYLVVS